MAEDTTITKEGTRLGVYLAACGVCSRREAAGLVDEARVKVNGVVVRDLSFQVVEGVHKVTFNNRPVRRLKTETLLYHKPKGVIISHESEGNLRSWTLDLPQYRHLRAAGRLDAMSEGLLVLTNDGDLQHLLTHPNAKVRKTYRVWLRGRLTDNTLGFLQSGGIVLDGRRVQRCQIRLLHQAKEGREHLTVWTLTEGRNRQIRRMAEAAGLVVTRLVRESVGPLKLRGIPTGGVKPMSPTEVDNLKKELSIRAAENAKPPRPPRKPRPKTAAQTKPRSASSSKPKTKPARKTKGP